MIFADFFKAVGQLGDPRFRRVLFLGIALTFTLLVAVTAAFLLLLGWLIPEAVTLPGVGTVNWVGDIVSLAGFFVMLILSVFLMVPVASAFTGLFLEDVAAAVEDRHYPHLPAVPRFGIYEAIRDSINFLGVLIVVNLIALVVVLFTAGFALPIFWLANGFLLGREYFQMVAMRRIGRERATQLRRAHAAQIWFAGTLMAVPLSVPIINLLIPILGVATFTHLFHRVSGSSGG